MTVPALTAVVVIGSQRGRAQRVLDALAVQAAPIEIVLVDCSPGSLPLALPSSPETRVVAAAGASVGAARAAGAGAARAPVVAYVEDHCYPEPGWAVALIDAHTGAPAAVGYSFANANPEAYASRVALAAEYGAWERPCAGGRVSALPGSNVSYRREVLAELGDELEAVLEIDFVLHRRLLAAGQELRVEPAAVVSHESFERLADLCRANADYSRLLGARRARLLGWGMGRRLLYGVAAPLAVPVLRLVRLVAARPGRRRALLPVLPGVLVVFLATGVGESLGYVRGEGHVADRFVHWELDAARGEPG